MQAQNEPPRTMQLLAERWATRFCEIQRHIAMGDALKFTGAGLAVVAWCTFVILAKGTMDFQASDLILPAIVTLVAIAVAAFGFSRERRAKRELKDATARLASELHKGPPSREAGQPSLSP
jgi:hypothetical protein